MSRSCIAARPARSDLRLRASITTPLIKALRGPLELAQYTSIDYTQTLDDHLVLASIGTVGDALDNALAESFVESYKTELIADRVWRSHAQVELATVAWVAWFNHDRLHESLGDIPPVEFEQLNALKPPITVNGSVAAISPRAANGLTTRRVPTSCVDFVANGPISPENAPVARGRVRSGGAGPLRPRQRHSRDERPRVTSPTGSQGGHPR